MLEIIIVWPLDLSHRFTNGIDVPFDPVLVEAGALICVPALEGSVLCNSQSNTTVTSGIVERIDILNPYPYIQQLFYDWRSQGIFVS